MRYFILYFTYFSCLLASSNSAISRINLDAIDSITIRSSASHMDFGTQMIEPGKTIYPKASILLTIDGLYKKISL